MSESSNHSISRRNALRGAAVVTAASLAAPALASATNALVGSGDGLRRYRGRYALPGGRVIDGYFVSPPGRIGLDTVVVLRGDRDTARAEQVANYFAASGKIAIVPDMPEANAKQLAKTFGKRAKANGNVQYVAA